MRKLISILTAFVLLVSAMGISAATDISLYLNKSKIDCDVAPVIINDRTLVPARALFEPLGASLKWNNTTRQATITMDDTVIKLTIDSETAQVNGKKVKLECAPIIVDGRTLFPVRFVAENLGYDVDWDNDTRSVLITTPVEKNKISAVNVSSTAELLSIKISFEQALSDFRDYFLVEPDRLILELNGCVYESKTIDIGIGEVQKLRMANHEEYFKMVVDMDSPLEYSLKQSSNKKTLTLKITTTADEETDTPDEDNKEDNESTVPEKLPGNPIVVLDPGHGGSDPGAIAYDEDDEIFAMEKDINLGIATYVYDILKSKGITVYMTRTDDTYTPLSQRATFANDLDATLFVSIHNNSHTKSDISGILTLYSADKDQASKGTQSSKDVAWTIQQKMVSAIGKESQGIRSEDELYVLRNTKMTAVLAEVLYMSNKSDVEYIKNSKNQLIAAKAIADGIIESLKEG